MCDVNEPQAPPTSVALSRWGWFVLIWASLVIFLGANVTSTQSGDATPDWPTSWHGDFAPPSRWVEIETLRNELSHRYGVALLLLFTVALALWVHLRRRERGVRVLAWSTVGLLVAQAVLGGLRVKRWIPAEVSAVAHAVLAEIYFCVLIGLLAPLTRSWGGIRRRPLDDRSLALLRTGFISVGLLLVQLTLGALGRHGFVPREIHAIFALPVVVLLVRFVLLTAGDLPRELALLRRGGFALGALTLAQVGLGIWTYVAAYHPDPRWARTFIQVLPLNLHLVVGAWLLGTTFFLTLAVIRVWGLPTDERLGEMAEAAS